MRQVYGFQRTESTEVSQESRKNIAAIRLKKQFMSRSLTVYSGRTGYQDNGDHPQYHSIGKKRENYIMRLYK